MKNILILLFTFISLNMYSQVEMGVAVAHDIENDISKLGLGTSYKILPKVSLGLGVMITPFEIDNDYEIMYNVKYNLGRLNVVGGFMKEMNPKMDSEPYFGIDYKLFKAPSHGVPVLIYDKTCPGSKSYFSFTDEFMSQESKIGSAA